MKFIVIEGLDGSGKSTQLKLIKKFLEDNNITYEYLHFPRTDAPIYGDLVARFLRGELGDIKNVNPYLVGLIYAGDRNDAGNQIRSWLDEGKYVIVDRYVYSNIAFQCAKISDEVEKAKLRDWIIDLEYNYHKIPKPDLNIYLDVPFEFTKNNLTNQRNGEDRDYLNGKVDIHEASLNFQENVRNEYLSLVERDNKFIKIDCAQNIDTILKPHEIFEKLEKELNKIVK